MGRKRLLTKEKVLGAINRRLVEHGKPPTVEELRRSLKVGSTRTVQRYLDWLEEEGDIERWSGARGLRVLKSPTRGLETRLVPLLGEAPAGPLLFAEENHQGWVRLPKDYFKSAGAKFFLLRVKGNSMNRAVVNGERIEDGDLALVRQQPRADAGEVVVVLVDGEATIKHLAKGPGYYLLKPDSADPKHEPIIVTQDFRVQGIVCRVFKKGGQLLEAFEE